MDKIFFEKLYNSIKNNPNDWEPDNKEYTFVHKKTELEIWIFNRREYVSIYKPVELKCFSFWQKIKLWRLIKKLLKGHKEAVFLKDLKIVENLISKLD